MHAILIEEGLKYNIYLLVQNNGEIELKNFFEKNRHNTALKGVISGFEKMLKLFKDRGGAGITRNMTKVWQFGFSGRTFAEFKKGDYRISYCIFEEIKKVLLLTIFKKTKNVEKSEYHRAMRLLERFNDNPVWRD